MVPNKARHLALAPLLVAVADAAIGGIYMLALDMHVAFYLRAAALATALFCTLVALRPRALDKVATPMAICLVATSLFLAAWIFGVTLGTGPASEIYKDVLGASSLVGSVLLAASPTLAHRGESTSKLFLLALTICAGAWAVLGMALNNWWIALPSLFNALLAGVQLAGVKAPWQKQSAEDLLSRANPNPKRSAAALAKANAAPSTTARPGLAEQHSSQNSAQHDE